MRITITSSNRLGNWEVGQIITKAHGFTCKIKEIIEVDVSYGVLRTEVEASVEYDHLGENIGDCE